MSNFKMDRRHLLAGAATLAVSDKASAQEAKASSLDVIDFHNHYIGPSFKITAPGGSPAQDQVNRNLASPSALLESIELAGIKARVVNTPTAFLEDADGKVPAETYLRIGRVPPRGVAAGRQPDAREARSP
jgi:aminocarboxymuconate-semialdehyde decarboxylase